MAMKLKYTTYNLEAENGLLVTRPAGKEIKEQIGKRLDKLEPNTVLLIDFSGIDFIDASCADEIVVRTMARIAAGEFIDRFVIYKNIADQHIENIQLALSVSDKLIIAVMASKWRILGSVNKSLRDCLIAIVGHKEVTARELQKLMGFKTVNEASTKLSKLYELGLIAREPFREPVRGGGRQFRYLSLLIGYKHDRDEYSTSADLI